MKLSKIYSNKPELFKSIIFQEGLNFIVSDDHSVGKTKLFELIDYCLMKDKPSFFKLDVFNKTDLTFYLELQLNNHRFLTIRRCIKGRANNAIKELDYKEDLTDWSDAQFDEVGSDEQIFSSLNQKINIELNSKITNFRHYLNYFLRNQDNQSDIFRLNKFLRTKDISYKPIIAELVGIEGNAVHEKYELENNIEKWINEIKFYEAEIGKETTKEAVEDKINLLLDKRSDKEDRYKNFDFYLSEHNISSELVKEIESDISKFNQQRNSLLREVDYINQAVSQELSLNLGDIEELFKEVQILFPENVKSNYEQVLNFNKQMATDRKQILLDNKSDFESELENINSVLIALNSKRSDMLSVLKDTDTMSKFKKLEREIIEIEAGIKHQEDKLLLFSKIETYKKDISTAEERLKKLKIIMQKGIKNTLIKTIKENVEFFSQKIFNEDALFSIGLNTHDNIEFSMDLANNGNFDNEKADGHTIKKLLCFIFSAALLKTYQKNHFFRFVAFDSPFDGDKYDYQYGLYEAFKDLSALNMQVIITTIIDEIKDPNIQNEIQRDTVCTLSSTNRLLGEF